MNGNWYPWSLGSTPSDYIMAWRHIYNIFSNKGLDSTRLQWVWCVNSNDQGNYTAENYWVGDNYVDWIGVDGYNFGIFRGHPWIWPNQVFDNMLGRLRKLSSTKPIGITEYGTSSERARNVSDVQSKTEWLNQFCDYISNSEIKMASNFNEDKVLDLGVFGGIHGDVVWNNFNAYSAYKNCLQSNDWIQPNSTNERLITDEQFAGRM
jgi:beta-mannanase